MATQLGHISNYLRQTLGIDVGGRPWANRARLPLFLRQAYEFYELEILGRSCLAVVDRTNEEVSPSTIRKHTAQLLAKFPGEIIYVRERMASYQRTRLIEHQIAFLVPGNQLYLPSFGMDLREFYRTRRETPVAFTPAAQLVLLYLLLQKSGVDDHSPNDLAQRLDYSKMTMTRVFNELEERSVGEINTSGRHRLLSMPEDHHGVWQKALPFLRSPVTKRHHIRLAGISIEGVTAGLSALSHYSMLSAPPQKTVAVTGRQWKSVLSPSDRRPLEATDPEGLQVEVWSYDPAIFAEGGLVDRLSLFLALRETHDERIEAALAEMMEGIIW